MMDEEFSGFSDGFAWNIHAILIHKNLETFI